KSCLTVVALLLSQLAFKPAAFALTNSCSGHSSLPCPDHHDPPPCCGCAPGGGLDNGGPWSSPGGGQGCRMCASVGMPTWWVSEPYINLRMEDEPLGYQPAHGARVAFRLSYRQRGAVLEDPAVFGVGINWSCSFRAYVVNLD